MYRGVVSFAPSFEEELIQFARQFPIRLFVSICALHSSIFSLVLIPTSDFSVILPTRGLLFFVSRDFFLNLVSSARKSWLPFPRISQSREG